MARPYPHISTTKRTRLWLCCIFPSFFFLLYNLLYCYLYCIVFISKGKCWCFSWMFLFVCIFLFDGVIRSMSQRVCLHFWSLCVLILCLFLLSVKLAGYSSLGAGHVLPGGCLFLFPFSSRCFSVSVFTTFSAGSGSFIIEVLSLFSGMFSSMSQSLTVLCHTCQSMYPSSNLCNAVCDNKWHA